MARAISATPWPMLTTAACPAASRYRFPSEASIQQPEALLAMGYVARKLRGNSAEESDISTPGPILTDRARTQIKGEASEAIAPANHRRSEEHTSELQSRLHLVCRLLLEKKKKIITTQSQ